MDIPKPAPPRKLARKRMVHGFYLKSVHVLMQERFVSQYIATPDLYCHNSSG
jgi:hypothetical protein